MKNIFLVLCFILSTFSFAQIGIKGGLTYNADEGLYKSVQNTYSAKGEGSTGYHLGLYKKINITGLYILPELWYVNYKTEFEDVNAQEIEIQYKRIDLPISIGTEVLGVAQIQAGPVFSYYFEDDINIDKVKEIEQEDISLALQVGAGISIQNLDVSLRYDFPLGKRETEWIHESDYAFVTENSPKLLHISLGYNF